METVEKTAQPGGKLKVDNAIILAAGFGSRFVPYTFEKPKGMVEVDGVPMLETQIKQLHEAGITDITIVVGYLRKEFQPLIDRYNLKPIYNRFYYSRNTISSLYEARHELKNTYILSSDNLLKENLYHPTEDHSWYCLSYHEGRTAEWCVEQDDDGRITSVRVGGRDAWHMYGPVFFSKEFSDAFVPFLEQDYANTDYYDWYWEDVLIHHLDKLPPIYGNRQEKGTVWEFECWEELREYDTSYLENPRNECIETICEHFGVTPDKINSVECVKQGKTNQSFTFWLDHRRYVYRRPGPGSSQMVDRRSECQVLEAVQELGLSDEVVFFDPSDGRRISRYVTGARMMNPASSDEVAQAMSMIRRLHRAGIEVDHEFVLADEIDRYEEFVDLEKGIARWEDFVEVRDRVVQLQKIVRQQDRPRVLCHGDCVFANFLVDPDDKMVLIDWEYAGMSDPLTDPVMFSLYSDLGPKATEKLWETFLKGKPSDYERALLQSYTGLAGYLWSLWCVRKEEKGVDLGDYPEVQWRFAREYTQLALEAWAKLG